MTQQTIARQIVGCVLLAAGALLAYVVIPTVTRGDELLLPLDDVYIHFQYAQQIANGQPYIYNPGLPPSSGATSLLYPYLLASGYSLGFHGLALGVWALLIGTVALAASCWLLLQMAQSAGLPWWASWLMVAAFVLTGSIGWHYMSGMETGLLICLMLLTLYAMLKSRFALGVFAAALMAGTRPEGAIMAIVVAALIPLTYWRHVPRWQLGFAALPVLAIGLQPLVNRVLTGSGQAAGSSAKSILGMVPPDVTVIATRIAGNFGRTWWEFLTGYSVREGLYLPMGLLLLAVVGVVWLLRTTPRRWDVALLTLGWLGGGTLAVATLDPAFWHFKRYQMPFMALLFPLAAWGLVVLWRWRRATLPALLTLVVASAAISSIGFWQAYQLNVGYLQQQQLPMAHWLRDNTPQGAVIAVHDVGMMRYVGERTTVDLVGLTTPGAADSWRNGPGAVAEFLERYNPRPHYVASYTDALGLSYLADTGLYGDLLAEYPVTLDDRRNVALAGAYQGVWAIDWAATTHAPMPKQPYPLQMADSMTLVDEIDVADLQSEAAHTYTWANDERLPGFPTEVYTFGYAACATNCTVQDGGRRINGEERFTLQTQPGQDVLLVTRVHPAHAGSYTVSVDGVPIATRTLPSSPGTWTDVATLIPAQYVSEQTTITVQPHTPGGHYMPYHHWAYQGAFEQRAASGTPVASFDEVLLMRSVQTRVEGNTFTLDYTASHIGTERADYRAFVHVYADLDAPPLAQADRYPLDGATPPGNWLPGEVHDTFVVDLSNLTSGTYTTAIGFYDPASGERLLPTSGVHATRDGRLILGEFEVE